MATLAPHQPVEATPAHWTEGNPDPEALAHIPGEGGWPIVGNTFKMLADPHGMAKKMVARNLISETAAISTSRLFGLAGVSKKTSLVSSRMAARHASVSVPSTNVTSTP